MTSFLRREWSLLLALLLACWLRGQQLGDQILVGDEWHALEKAAGAGYGEIATTLGTADHSIPIALYYRLVADTFGLSEAWIRAPFLLAGLATVLGLALAARRFVERPTADLFAWVLAVSPVLVFYSRFARPYVFTCPLAVAAVLLFHAWWRGRKRSTAVLYALTAAAAGYLHTAVLPFVLAPFPFWFVGGLRAPAIERRRAWRALFGLGCLAGGLLALCLLPPILLDRESLGAKSGWGTPPLGTVLRALRVFAGTDSGSMAIGLLFPVAAGVVLLVRRVPEVAALFLSAAILQCAVVLVIAPAQRSDVFAFARYILPLLPLALLALAVGVGALARRVARILPPLAGPLLGGWMLAVGPLPSTWFRPDNWSANHLAFGILRKQADLVANTPRVPDFYLRLEREPGSTTLIEAPWFAPVFANPLPHYQRIHRQHTLIGFTPSLPSAGPKHGGLPRPTEGFALEHFLFVEDLLDSAAPPADYLVLHRDLRREYDMHTAPVLARLADEQHVDIAPLVARCRQRFGAPEFEDELLVVFRLR